MTETHTDSLITANVHLMLENLDVQRGDLVLCQSVNLSVLAGQICHIVGDNGAGKSTLLMQVAGLLPIVSGSVYFCDVSADTKCSDTVCCDKQYADKRPGNHRADARHIQSIRSVYLSHQLGIHLDLTVEMNLRFLLSLYGINPSKAQLNSALTWVGLIGYETVVCHQLSAGQKRRVNLARLAMMSVEHTPLWLLDEPLTALDVRMQEALLERLQEFCAEGGIVLMTSHQPVSLANKVLELSSYN